MLTTQSPRSYPLMLCLLVLAIAGPAMPQSPGPHLVARLSFKRVRNPNGNPHGHWTTNRIADWVTKSNYIFRQTGVSFIEDEIVDIDDPDDLYNYVAGTASTVQSAAESNTAAYAWRKDAINVYLVGDIQGAGGECSFPGATHDEIILIAPNILNQEVGLAHELGHYFNLLHPHTAPAPNPTCANPSPDTHPDDLCLDTATDPFNTSESAFSNMNYVRLIYDGCHDIRDGVLYNVMSYYENINWDTAQMTRGQRSRVIEAAKLHRRHVMLPYANDMRKVLITEFHWGNPDWLEVTNFSSETVTMSLWRLTYRVNDTFSPTVAGIVPAVPTGPGSSLLPGETAVIVEQGGSVPAGTPVGTKIFYLTHSINVSSNDIGIALGDGFGNVVDELHLANLSGLYDQEGLGGAFYGEALRASSASGQSVERIWGLDSDSGEDWTYQTVATPGRENSSNGPRGTDPRLDERVQINEVDARDEYIEIKVTESETVNLKSWFLMVSGYNGQAPMLFAPFPERHRIISNGYTILGSSATAPAELPTSLGIPYRTVSPSFPFNPLGEYQIALYDHFGRLVDVVRAANPSNRLTHNHPRCPSAWDDFLGSAGNFVIENHMTSFEPADARIGEVDTNSGADWAKVFHRTMGFANPSSTSTPLGRDYPLDVRLNGTWTGTGLTLIINAGPNYANYPWTFTFGSGHALGHGPFFGMAWDALPNFFAISQAPGLTGTLDADGLARLDFPADSFPAGFQTDNRYFLFDPSTGALVAMTDIFPYGS